MTLPKLLAKTQVIFNAWIRERDKNNGCISCGGEVNHAGHYYSQGHYSSLRFNPINVNGQCIKCNTYMHGNLINYRKGLIKKYGPEVVENLENTAEVHKVYKWDRLDLELIITNYGKTKSRKAVNGNNTKGAE
jgi:hypothetical protein